MRRLTVLATGVLLMLLAIAPAAHAAESSTISASYTVTFPSGNPPVGTASGTFVSSGAITDTGTLSGAALFGAVPAPSTGVLQTKLTLSGSGGTILLRCSQIAKDFSDLSNVPDTGSCAVIGGTGSYAGLHGHATVIGYANLNTATVKETIFLSSP
jgi:hypothetical protein